MRWLFRQKLQLQFPWSGFRSIVLLFGPSPGSTRESDHPKFFSFRRDTNSPLPIASSSHLTALRPLPLILNNYENNLNV